MNPEIKQLWINALRSGDYRQGTGRLRNPYTNEFCCLGVLCNLHAQAHPKCAKNQKIAGSYMGQIGYLPNAVAEWAGLVGRGRAIGVTYRNKYTHLTALNDDKLNFKQIANVIERCL